MPYTPRSIHSQKIFLETRVFARDGTRRVSSFLWLRFTRTRSIRILTIAGETGAGHQPPGYTNRVLTGNTAVSIYIGYIQRVDWVDRRIVVYNSRQPTRVRVSTLQPLLRCFIDRHEVSINLLFLITIDDRVFSNLSLVIELNMSCCVWQCGTVTPRTTRSSPETARSC